MRLLLPPPLLLFGLACRRDVVLSVAAWYSAGVSNIEERLLERRLVLPEESAGKYCVAKKPLDVSSGFAAPFGLGTPHGEAR